VKIEHHEIMHYAIFFIVPVLLIWYHNWLISHIKQVNQQLATAHEAKAQIAVSLGLFICTVLLMLFLAPSLPHLWSDYGLLAIGFTLISSLLIMRFFLSRLLKEMRCQRLFFKLFINQYFLLTLFFMIATELLVLYWLKESTIYVQDQFLQFVMGYALLMITGSIFLNVPKQKGPFLKQEWRLTVVAIIDPIIVISFSVILLYVLLNLFYQFLL